MPAKTDRIKGNPTAATPAQAAGQKKKRVLVVVLLVGLLTAIVTQPDDQDTESGQVVGTPPAASLVSSTNNSSKVKALASAEKCAESLLQIRELSRIKLAEITRLELFAPEPQRLRVQNRINRGQSVQAIYGTSTDRAALVGQQIIHSGQPLDGQRVLDVTMDGIRLAQ